MDILKRIKQSSQKIGSFVFINRNLHIKNPLGKLAGLLCIAALTILLYYSGIGCVWKYFFNIPCPGCGMTRAVLSALRGDIKGMFAYHFMAPSLPVLLAYILYDGRIFKNKRIDNYVLIIIALGFLVHWVMEIYFVNSSLFSRYL